MRKSHRTSRPVFLFCFCCDARSMQATFGDLTNENVCFFPSLRPWPLSVVTSFANTASRGGRVVPLVVSSTVPTAEKKSPPSIQTSPSTTSSSHSSGTCQTSNRQIGGRPLKSAKVSQHHKQKYSSPWIQRFWIQSTHNLDIEHHVPGSKSGSML